MIFTYIFVSYIRSTFISFVLCRFFIYELTLTVGFIFCRERQENEALWDLSKKLLTAHGIFYWNMTTRTLKEAPPRKGPWRYLENEPPVLSTRGNPNQPVVEFLANADATFKSTVKKRKASGASGKGQSKKKK